MNFDEWIKNQIESGEMTDYFSTQEKEIWRKIYEAGQENPQKNEEA